MNRSLFSCLIFSFFVLFIKSQTSFSKKLQVSFTENKGQVYDQYYHNRPDVLYYGDAGLMAFHVRSNGISYQLHKTTAFETIEKKFKTRDMKIPSAIDIYRIDINWPGANTQCEIITDEAMPGLNNYYLSVCPNGVLNVRSYKGLTLKSIYHAIDLHYYEKEGTLKYDYIVKPGADYKQISLQVNGATSISSQVNGNVLIETPLGKISEGKPIVMQDGRLLEAKWHISGNTLSFDIKDYDPTKEFIIDPVTRLWGSFYGGSDDDYFTSCITDGQNNVLLSGTADSFSGIATTGAFQTTMGGNNGIRDAMLVKFNPSGVRQWATYFGENGVELGEDVAVDNFGNPFLCGFTANAGGPPLATAGAVQPINGGNFDSFLAKFNSSGARVWCTYYGDNGYDEPSGVATDLSGNVYLVGTTSSGAPTPNVISTQGSHQVNTDGSFDGYLAKFDSVGNRYWGTYYGGAGNDGLVNCVIDKFGNIFAVGNTTLSTTQIASPNAYQTTLAGNNEGFFVKFNSSGARIYGSYYGGVGDDYINNVTIDSKNNYIFSGYTTTSSGSAIASFNSYQSIHAGGVSDGFIAKVDSGGQRQWATYVGGAGFDALWGCAADTSGNIYFSGWADSLYSLANSGNYQQMYGGHFEDIIIGKLNKNGALLWHTFYGGNGIEASEDCCVDGTGALYVSGWTQLYNGTMFATSGCHQPLPAGNTEGIIAKFKDCKLNIAPVSQLLCPGNSATLTALGCTTYTWSTGSNNSSIVVTPSVNTVYTVTGTDINGCISSIAINQYVSGSGGTPTISVNSGTICQGQTFTLNPSGVQIYTITGGSSIVSPTTTTNYTITGIAANGCVNNTGVVATVSVLPAPPININPSNTGLCSGDSIALTVSGASNYTWSTGATTSSIMAIPSSNTTYSAVTSWSNGCYSQSSATVMVSQVPTVSVNNGTICGGINFTLVPSGAASYSFANGGPVVAPYTNTSYSVYGNNNGCISAIPAISYITVKPSPTITLNGGFVCYGGSTNLSPTGANTYTYLSGGPVVSPTVGTTYSVIGTGTNGCISTPPATVYISVFPTLNLTASTNSMICTGQSVTLSVTGANSYIWSNGIFGPAIIVTPTVTTTYSVTGYASGCNNTVSYTQSVSLCTGVTLNENTEEPYSIFPNPTKSVLNIESKQLIERFEVFNSLGEIVLAKKVATSKYQLNILELAQGLYYIRIYSDNENIIVKIIKE
jgi:hypothetical protein